MIFSNLGDFLTVGNERLSVYSFYTLLATYIHKYQHRVKTISDIISTQIKWNQSNNFTNEPIELLFEVTEVCIQVSYIIKVKGAQWYLSFSKILL